MSKWSLKIGRSSDITVDESGNLQLDNPSIFEMNEKDAVIEARRRVKSMRYFIIGEDTSGVITFDMFYKRFQRHSLFKLGYKMVYYSIYMLFHRMFGNSRGKV